MRCVALFAVLLVLLCASAWGISFVSAPEAIPVSQGSSKLVWKTDVVADATVKVATSASALESSPTVLPLFSAQDASIVPADNLPPGTTIYYNVTVCDATACTASLGEYTTLELGSVTVSSILAYNATVNISANMPIEGSFRYGTRFGIYDHDVPFSKKKNISIELDGLNRAALYYFQLDLVFGGEHVLITPNPGTFRTLRDNIVDYFEIDDFQSSIRTANITFPLSGQVEQNARVFIYRRLPRSIVPELVTMIETDDTGEFLYELGLVCGTQNNISVLVRDPYLNTASQNFLIDCDNEAPTLLLERDFDYYTNGSEITFRASIDSNATIDVNVTQIHANRSFIAKKMRVVRHNEDEAFSDFEFTIDLFRESSAGSYEDVPLGTGNAIGGLADDPDADKQGLYRIMFTVADDLGNSKTITQDVYVDTIAPAIVIESYDEEVQGQFVRLRGKTKPGARVRATNLANESEFFEFDRYNEEYVRTGKDLQGRITPAAEIAKIDPLRRGLGATGLIYESEDTADDEGNFVIDVFLVEGENQIAFYVTDQAGNTLTKDDNECSFNGRLQECIITIRMVGTNDQWRLLEHELFPSPMIFTQISSDQELARTGRIMLTLAPRIDPSLVRVASVRIEMRNVKDSHKLQFTPGNPLFAWKDDHFVVQKDFVVGQQTDLDKIENYQFEYDVTIIYAVEGMTLTEIDEDPIRVKEELVVEKPENFIDWLSEENLNRVIDTLSFTQNKVVRPSITVAETASFAGILGCFGSTIFMEIKKGAGLTPTQLRNHYWICDRIACPYVPPNCQKYLRQDFESLSQQNYNYIEMDVQSRKDLDTDVARKLEYTFYINPKPDNKDLLEVTEEKSGYAGQSLNALNLKQNANDPSHWPTECQSRCGTRQNCVRARSTINDKQYQGVASSTNRLGEESQEFLVEGASYACTDESSLHTYLEKSMADQNFNALQVTATCYNAGAWQYHETSCIVNQFASDPTNPPWDDFNPSEGLYSSLACGCTTGAYQHLSNIDRILSEMRECIEGAKDGQFDAGYCKELIGYYTCDFVAWSIREFRESRDRSAAELHAGTIAAGCTRDNALELQGKEILCGEQLKENIKSRYEDTVLSKSGLGLSTDGVFHRMCLGWFGIDVGGITPLLRELIKQKEAPPVVGPVIVNSRLGFPDPSTGKMTIFYDYKMGIFPAGSDVRYTLQFLCDNQEKNSDGCPASVNRVVLYNVSSFVPADKHLNDDLVWTDPDAKWWANRVRLEWSYTVDGKQYTQQRETGIRHWGVLPAGCKFEIGFDNAIRCESIATQVLGGNLHILRARASPTSTFHPGDKVGIKLSLENNRYDRSWALLRLNYIEGPKQGTSQTLTLPTSLFAHAEQRDVLLHVTSLGADPDGVSSTILYPKTNAFTGQVISNELARTTGLTDLYFAVEEGTGNELVAATIRYGQGARVSYTISQEDEYKDVLRYVLGKAEYNQRIQNILNPPLISAGTAQALPEATTVLGKIKEWAIDTLRPVAGPIANADITAIRAINTWDENSDQRQTLEQILPVEVRIGGDIFTLKKQPRPEVVARRNVCIEEQRASNPQVTSDGLVAACGEAPKEEWLYVRIAGGTADPITRIVPGYGSGTTVEFISHTTICRQFASEAQLAGAKTTIIHCENVQPGIESIELSLRGKQGGAVEVFVCSEKDCRPSERLFTIRDSLEEKRSLPQDFPAGTYIASLELFEDKDNNGILEQGIDTPLTYGFTNQTTTATFTISSDAARQGSLEILSPRYATGFVQCRDDKDVLVFFSANGFSSDAKVSVFFNNEESETIMPLFNLLYKTDAALDHSVIPGSYRLSFPAGDLEGRGAAAAALVRVRITERISEDADGPRQERSFSVIPVSGGEGMDCSLGIDTTLVASFKVPGGSAESQGSTQ